MDETDQDSVCYGPGSIAGAVIGTFFTTALLLAIAAFLYRQWRRHKGKHLVLVTDPEIVEDAYAFDNPCFKDATGQIGSMERPLSVAAIETQIKDSPKWSTPWSGLGLGAGNKHDKRRTLDDSCLGPKATRVSVVSLRSRDFTGLGFNVAGNMREGIFVKDLLHRGPASESGRIHPGDRITSVKISFRSMVYEDALTILSYASPYDVELEVESGGSGSRPTTLLKKTVGPSPTRICHPIYRSQSIPELSRVHKSSAKRLFIADPTDSLNCSNYSPLNSTLKSSKSTPGSHTFERQHEEAKTNNHHQKFGIKVLPTLEGTVHRIENQNEHNTNLERKHSRKRLDVERREIVSSTPILAEKTSERLRQRENRLENGADSTDCKASNPHPRDDESMIPSEVPAEVHNAAMAARRNRKSSAELLSPFKPDDFGSTPEPEDRKSPQKNKRKAPAPPASPIKDDQIPSADHRQLQDRIDTIADYTESLSDYVEKVMESETDGEQTQLPRADDHSERRNSAESDTDSEMQHSFTTIELNPSDITIHHTPVPRAPEDETEDDVYRKAASLGDLSKYEAKSSSTLERAQSLDMADAGLKKRKAPLPPEDIAEFNEDLTKLDDIEAFDRVKLKKSSEWGTLEDAIWKKADGDGEEKPKARKKSSGTLERSKSAVEIKLKEDNSHSQYTPSPGESDDCSAELYNLPLSKRLTRDFIHAERMFNPDEDNALVRIVNNGRVLKSPTPEQVELDFRQAKPMDSPEGSDPPAAVESFDQALRFFDLHTWLSSKQPVKADPDTINGDNRDMYVGMKQVREEPVRRITVNRRCPVCERNGQHDKHCQLHVKSNGNHDDSSKSVANPVDGEVTPSTLTDIERQIESISGHAVVNDDEDVDDGCDLELGVTVNSKRLTPEDQHNVSNISVSSEDSGLVGESGEFNADSRPPLPNTPAPPQKSSKKLTYITEIKVSPRDGRENLPEVNEIHPKPPRGQVTITSNGKPTPGKKPPVPPRRSDSAKSSGKDAAVDKQVVYVSEFKSPEISQTEVTDGNDKSTGNKKFERWIFLGENREESSWGNGSNQPQPVTNIVVSSGEEKIFK
ncbi:uncharacterized protein LOC107038284 [Diachasma alloeum]|uniref:uncharacterized protein LOC107038284 n=1 Tax=Diachasma alloeum TaxID=454923 RepID=UPI0007382250|nr:uncharacterized protein LOC107038284 [Diachasma alloeum]